MHLKIGVLRHLEFHIELRVAAGWRMEFDIGVAAVDIDVHVRALYIAFAPRLDGVVQADVVGFATLDVQVAHAKAYVHHATGGEVANLAVRLFVAPVVRGGTKGHQQKVGNDYRVEQS
jgi:hypothetical protein